MLEVKLHCCVAQNIQESCQANPCQAEASTSKGGMFKPVNLTYFLLLVSCCKCFACIAPFLLHVIITS